jgi:hypothetical protein
MILNDKTGKNVQKLFWHSESLSRHFTEGNDVKQVKSSHVSSSVPSPEFEAQVIDSYIPRSAGNLSC